MSTFTQIYYHLVFSTKERERVLVERHHEEFFRYAWGIIRNKDSHLYRINAVEDHMHILTSLHPSVALADFVKDVKVATSVWIKEKGLFPGFAGWQEGYGGFTASHADKDRLIEYIKNQQEHHRVKSFREELRELLLEAGVEFDEKLGIRPLRGRIARRTLHPGFHPGLFGFVPFGHASEIVPFNSATN